MLILVFNMFKSSGESRPDVWVRQSNRGVPKKYSLA